MNQHIGFDSQSTDQEDPELLAAAERLHQVQIRLRWAINVALIIFLLPPSLWDLRQDIQLWFEHFTWTAVRYGLAFHPWSALGILSCVAFITSTLIWQTRNIIWGLPQREHYRLQQRALKIRNQGQRSLLWKWVWGSE